MTITFGHIKPDMRLSKAERAADRAAWDALEDENKRLRAALQKIADGKEVVCGGHTEDAAEFPPPSSDGDGAVVALLFVCVMAWTFSAGAVFMAVVGVPSMAMNIVALIMSLGAVVMGGVMIWRQWV